MTDVNSKDVAALAEFVKKWSGATLKSTGAVVVDYSGVLYNVIGSSDDPNINGSNWKSLLVTNGINSECYVDNIIAPAGSSHPGFDVGGHMTPNSDGSVQLGGVCYLIPLCAWHNHSARNGEPFEHNKTDVIKLNGYMEAEPAVTFMARQPSHEDYSMISISRETGNQPDKWSVSRDADKDILFESLVSEVAPPFFVLLKKGFDNGEVSYSIEEARLPHEH